MPIIVRDNGVVIDTAAGTLDFLAPLNLVPIGTGVVQVVLDPGGITNAHIDTAANIDAAKIDPATLAELVRDTLGAAIVAGAGIALLVSDLSDTITVSASFAGTGSTNTVARSDHSHTPVITIRNGGGNNLAAGTSGNDTATCNAGELVVGGGGFVSSQAGMKLIQSFPNGSTGWRVSADNSAGVSRTITAQAVCMTSTI